jgi:HJR/Mrr/RecB family endonuclease
MTKQNDIFDYEDEMMWETHAREAIEEATDEAELDEVRGVIYLMSGIDHHYNPIEEGFSSAEEIRERLTEIGETEWISYVPFDGGAAVFEPNVEKFVENAMERHDIEAFFERIAPPDDVDELTTTRELTPPGGGLVIRDDVIDINAELIRYLARHPEKMREMNPRKFEELIAELFKDKGYEVELTPRTRDGGLDIRAFRRSDIGTCLTLVECKRYAANSPVSVKIVRGLYGVTESERATMGLIATTSYFTSSAKSFQAQNQYRIQLADFDMLKSWLNAYKRT